MENLIDVLNKEHSEYEKLLELSTRKTPVIVRGDLESIQKITDEEQIVVSRINQLEKKREEIIADIANVINKDVETLKLKNIIQMFENRPAEHKQLAEIHDKLQVTVKNMMLINERNRGLLKSSLEMVEFDMNILQAMKTAPKNANYGKGAMDASYSMGNARSGFDAKQ